MMGISEIWLKTGYKAEEAAEVIQKLTTLDYNPEKVTEATTTDVTALFGRYLGGVVLFSGRVIAKSLGFAAVLEDKNMCVTTSKVDEERSLYIFPLEKRIKEEYIRVNGIQTTDTILLEEKKISELDAFYLFVEDARKLPIASFEFHKEGGMLYVPKRKEA